MFAPLPLSLTTPRPALPLSTWLTDLTPQLIFGFILLFLCLTGVATTLILSPGWRSSLFFVLLILGMGYFGLQIRQKVLLRQQIYQYGTPVSAQVMGHGRAFNPLKSARDYAVTLKLQDAASSPIRITHSKADLWHVAPEGASLTGLVYQGHYLFAEELGRRFEIKAAQP